MRRTPPGLLALIVGCVGAPTMLFVRLGENSRRYLAPTSWFVWLAILVIAGLTLVMGLAVRAYVRGDRPGFDPIRAARTVALAKAAAFTGAILLGWYLGVVLNGIADIHYPGPRSRVISAAIAGLCSVILLVIGLIVERFCEVPPDEGEGEQGSEANPAT